MNIQLYGVMPYEPMILGLKFEIRIADLTARDVLVVTCPASHWTANVAPHILHSRYHEMRKLIHVQADMTCKRYGTQGGLHWRIERAVGPEYPRSA
ncbi:hypothetical protein [Sulfitobacter pontiacus]|uniref:hypothetical protein n=1 Tax=Sulfitobacter pontiacus TaxID=60137 RepID=UPI0030EC3C9F